MSSSAIISALFIRVQGVCAADQGQGRGSLGPKSAQTPTDSSTVNYFNLSILFFPQTTYCSESLRL